MRDPARIERILDKLRTAWLKDPDSRLCQLIVNVSGKNDPFFVEDDAMEAALENGWWIRTAPPSEQK